MQPNFKINNIIRRATIHDAYGGSRQSGISVSATYPYIFIFSSTTGHKHGYKDGWINEDVFFYTGEGQIGDMNFARGNLALSEHKKNEKSIFLFEYSSKGQVQFKGELELIEHGFFPGTDTTGLERRAIKFLLKKKEVNLDYLRDFQESIVEEPLAKYSTQVPIETERRGLINSRVGQGIYRKSILHRWKFACAVTGYQKHEILIASHIVPWRHANNNERLDVHNGILLSPTYDALFDQHLISFENNGKIILSGALKASDYHKIGISGREIIKNLSLENHDYLNRHRSELIF